MTAAVARPSAALGATDVLVEARRREAAGHRVIHLEVGEPDAPTPAHVVEAAVQALRDGRTRYVEPAGLPRLREAAAAHLHRRGLDAHAGRVVVTSGAKPLLVHAAACALAPGDEALVPDPGYPAAAEAVRMAGARPVAYRVHADGERLVDVGGIESLVTRRTRLLVLNSPHNPTGRMLGPDELDALADLAVRRDLVVVSDEIYWRHAYDRAHESIATRPGMAERTVVVDGFSKAYAMTGWRLGFGLLPERLVAPVTRLVANSTTCVPAFVQEAGIAALEGPDGEMRAHVAALGRRRDRVARALDAMPGVRCGAPQGAFYVFPCVRGLLRARGLSTEELATRLLHDAGVACVPGTAFGRNGDGRLRLSFAAPEGELEEALGRIGAVVG